MRRVTTLVVAVLVATSLAPAARAAQDDEGIADAVVAVVPSTDLVHEQEVQLRIDGWEPGDFPIVGHCPPGITDIGAILDDCEDVHVGRVGPYGRLRQRTTLDVILDRFEGDPVDCRLVTCELVLTSFFDQPFHRVPLTFDPAGPDPVRPTAIASPATDLVQDQVVAVTGEGFDIDPFDSPAGPEGGPDPPPRPVRLIQCREPVGDYADCGGRSKTVSLTTTGHLSTTFRVRARLSLNSGGSHDCRTGGCVLRVETGFEASEAAFAPLAFDPDGPAPPAPSVRIEPVDGLRDGQRVRAIGTDFEPGQSVTLYQCAAGATTIDRCHGEDDGGIGVSRRVDDQGDVVHPAHVHGLLRPLEGEPIDCRVEACELFMTPSEEAIDGAPATPMPFLADAPLLTYRVVLVPGQGLVDGQRATLRLRDHFPTYAVHAMQCVRRTATSKDFRTCSDATGRNIDPPGSAYLSTFQGPYVVHRWITTRADGRVDCRIRSCYIAVLAHDGFEVHFSQRIRFGQP